jgi:uncharacterized membrane protein YdbT with pleckstrin-like domain
MSLRDTILRVLRVPPTPEPPPGSPPRTFRAAPNFFKLKLVRWGVGQFAALMGLVWALIFIRWANRPELPGFVITLMTVGEILGWIAFLTQLVAGWVVVHLDYELRWYMLSDRAIRIREGITTIREKTIALANIQNIAIRQGPLQRLLGIADVEVKTAGGGGQSSEREKKSAAEPMHVAYFRGVANATEIRDLLREGVRRQKDAGLGDPDEVVAAPPDDDTEAALTELLTAARSLRQAVYP